jgi:hypothetical protein
MQVTRGDLIVFFNEIFDALCKLSADSDPSVQNAAHLMDRLVKVSTCVYKSLHFQKLFFMICPSDMCEMLLMLAGLINMWVSLLQHYWWKLMKLSHLSASICIYNLSII